MKVAVIAFSPLATDARILRQIRHLRAEHEVVVIAENPPPAELYGARFVGYTRGDGLGSRVWKALKRRVWRVAGHHWVEKLWLWSRESKCALKTLDIEKPDLVLVNEINPLPCAVKWTQVHSVPLLADLHEFYPEVSQSPDFIKLDRPSIVHRLRAAAHGIRMGMAVNEPIAERYTREFGFPCAVIYNAEDLSEMPHFRAVDPGRIDLVHIGVYQKLREPINMAKAMRGAPPQWHLHFYLVGPEEEIDCFKRECEACAPGRVTIHPAVPPGKITETISRYDIGISIIPPKHWSWLMAAPNKMFSFVAAGLGMILPPKPWKKMMSERYDFAELTTGYSPDEICNVIVALTPGRINELKRNSVKAAAELNGQAMQALLLEICRQAVKN